MSAQRYTLPAIALHWAMAIIILWLFWLGWTMTDLPKGAGRSAAYSLHKSLGLLIFLLVFVRLAWRWRHPAPPMLDKGWAEKLARLTHLLLYAFMVLAPLAGYLASSFTPYAIKLFGIEIPKVGGPDEALNALFKALHQGLVWGGGALVALHLAGAVKQTRRGWGVLRRMLPG